MQLVCPFHSALLPNCTLQSRQVKGAQQRA
jgi:hypothetical protein